MVAEIARQDLVELGEEMLAKDMEDDLSAEHALRLAVRILMCASKLEAKYADKSPKPHGRGLMATVVDGDDTVRWTKFASFEQALADIRLAGTWYGAVGRLGYGVKTQWW